MFTSIYSGAVCGIDGQVVCVEADISDGFPTYSLVGYLASEVKEARERVTAALKNSGYRMPAKKIIINLSPAGLRKQGTAYDLPIALAILGSLGVIPQKNLKSVFAVGELSLDGSLRPVKGILSLMLMAKKQGFLRCLVPAQNVGEACLVRRSAKPCPEIIGVSDLQMACGCLSGEREGAALPVAASADMPVMARAEDFSGIVGQELLKRAIVVAVSGMHHFLMIGPPGCGKSMSARAIRGIMPPMTFEESLEVTQLYSVAGILEKDCALVTQRPFRSPHHTIPIKAMTGGGRVATPGEVSLAHRGILFMDELAEFSPAVLEILRQPLEEGVISINRLHGSFVFPAGFMLVAAMNPCKCGYYPDRSRCRCSPKDVYQYLHRISRPLWNRIDVCVEVQPPRPAIYEKEDIFNRKKRKEDSGEELKAQRLCSQTMALMVKEARQIQAARFKDSPIYFNAEMPAELVNKYCITEPEERGYVDQLVKTLELSMRGRHKLLKVARTIADLDGKELISMKHLDEAVCYRTVEQSYWEY